MLHPRTTALLLDGPAANELHSPRCPPQKATANNYKYSKLRQERHVIMLRSQAILRKAAAALERASAISVQADGVNERTRDSLLALMDL